MNTKYRKHLKQNFDLCRPIVKFASFKHSATSFSNAVFFKSLGYHQQVIQVYKDAAAKTLWNYLVHYPTQPLSRTFETIAFAETDKGAFQVL